MATAEAVYVDPSALKLCAHQPESVAVNAWRARVRGPLLLTQHGSVEIANGICLAAFRGDIGNEAMRDALASFDEDVADGRYVRADLLWRAALDRARDLSEEHTPALGCRSLDVLHVASALELECKRFLTFDLRQRRPARAAGPKLGASACANAVLSVPVSAARRAHRRPRDRSDAAPHARRPKDRR